MLVCKYIILFFIFVVCSKIGILTAKKYKDRVEVLQDFKILLNILKAKIKFTYEPLPEIFNQISSNAQKNNKKICKVFENASTYMKTIVAGDAWNKAVDECKLIQNEEDKKVIKDMGNLLGRTDVDGQVNDIDLTISLLDEKIKVATSDLIKNEKMYRNLGSIIGAGIVIILF